MLPECKVEALQLTEAFRCQDSDADEGGLHSSDQECCCVAGSHIKGEPSTPEPIDKATKGGQATRSCIKPVVELCLRCPEVLH